MARALQLWPATIRYGAYALLLPAPAPPAEVPAEIGAPVPPDLAAGTDDEQQWTEVTHVDAAGRLGWLGRSLIPFALRIIVHRRRR